MLKCLKCGWVGSKPGKKAATKYRPAHEICPDCSSDSLGKQPLRERPGFCSECEHNSFMLKFMTIAGYKRRHLIRVCKGCGQLYDVELEKNIEDIPANKTVNETKPVKRQRRGKV